MAMGTATDRILRQVSEDMGDDEFAVVLYDGYDDALVGVGTHFNTMVAVYDRDLIVEALVAQGMEPDDAEEFVEVNVAGSWVGPGTPVIVRWSEGC